MVVHHGIAADVDTEDGSELLKPQANPLLAVIVVFSGEWILAAEKGPPYASNDAVVEASDVMATISWRGKAGTIVTRVADCE